VACETKGAINMKSKQRGNENKKNRRNRKEDNERQRKTILLAATV
jgi:hypothetical protein